MRMLVDVKKVRVHEDVATGQIQPYDAEILHLFKYAVNFVQGQLAGEKLRAVVGIGVAMPATKIATVRQLELRLDDLIVLDRSVVRPLTEVRIGYGRKRSGFRHDDPAAERKEKWEAL